MTFRGFLPPKESTSRHGKKEPGNTFVLTAIKTRRLFKIFLFGPLQALPKSTESVTYLFRPAKSKAVTLVY